MFLSALRAAARQGLRGTRDTIPVLCKVVDCSPALHVAVALRWLACWHSRCARTIDPGSKGCASHTRPGGSHLTGGLAVPSGLAAAARTVIHGGFETRGECAVGNMGSGPIGSAKVVWPSFDPLRSTRLDVACFADITAQGHWLTSRWLTRRSVVLLASSLSAQAASDDARA